MTDAADVAEFPHPTSSSVGTPRFGERTPDSHPVLGEVQQILSGKDAAPVTFSGPMDPDPAVTFRDALRHYGISDLQERFDAIKEAGNRAVAATYAHKLLDGHWRVIPYSIQRGAIAFRYGPPMPCKSRVLQLRCLLDILAESEGTPILAQGTSWVEGYANERVRAKATLTKEEAAKLPLHRQPIAQSTANLLRRTYYLFLIDTVGVDVADNHGSWPKPVDGRAPSAFLTQGQTRELQSCRIKLSTRGLLAGARMMTPAWMSRVKPTMVERHGPLVFIRLPPTKAMPQGLLIPILVDGKAIEDLAAEFCATGRKDEPLFGKGISRRIADFRDGLSFKVTAKILRESFWASLLVIRPGCDAYLYALGGFESVRGIIKLRKQVERLLQAGHDLALPSSFGYAYSEVPCQECGHGNPTDAGDACEVCGCNLTLDFSATTMAKAALHAVVNQLFEAGMRYTPDDIKRASQPLGGGA
jgi:hypothetical protein